MADMRTTDRAAAVRPPAPPPPMDTATTRGHTSPKPPAGKPSGGKPGWVDWLIVGVGAVAMLFIFWLMWTAPRADGVCVYRYMTVQQRTHDDAV